MMARLEEDGGWNRIEEAGLRLEEDRVGWWKLENAVRDW